MASTGTSETSGVEGLKVNRATDNIATCDSCRRINWTCIGGPICEKCEMWGFDCMFTAGAAIADLKREFEMLLLPGSPIPPPYKSPEDDSKHVGEKTALVEDRAAENLFRVESSSDHFVEPFDTRDSSAHRELRKRRCSRCYRASDHCDEKTRLCSRCRRKSRALFRPDAEPYELRLRILNEERRRLSRAAACDSCRSIKAKCNEVQPCHMCRANGTECTYKSTHAKTSRSSSPPQISHAIMYGLLNPEFHSPQTANTLPLPPYHPSMPPLTYETILGLQIPYSHESTPFTLYTSVPSGCTSCFESKTRCSRPSGFPCLHCASLSIDCTPFPPGTRLAPCQTCSQAKKLCTNVRKGLSCDDCVERGLECSRLKIGGPTYLKKATGPAGFLIGPESLHGEAVSDDEKDPMDSLLRAGLQESVEQERALDQDVSIIETSSEDEGGYGWCMVTHEEVTGAISEAE